ncbi:hypothetical protein DM02DRAFT_673045 [Periconia macrospinosa]|uniref:Protein kinase domain-containing protein n=1 Tax=Periconia macrospinosa TaxID=97972 RepID=A0A2V1DLP8_9PLEO|nr:hypothetical protein DM02DRAFT_673045 [Periconia macrospinosa]
MSGLEIASLALAVATTTETLVDTLVSGIRDTARFGPGFEKARLGLRLEATTLKLIRRVLFGQSASLSSSLFTAFDRQTQIDIINVLRLFKETLESKYCLELAESPNSPSRAPSFMDVTDPSVAFGSYHSASLVRRLRWGFSEKTKIDMTRQELHGWNEQLLNIIKIQIIGDRIEKLNKDKGKPYGGSPAPLLQLLFGEHTKSDANSLGLEIDLRLTEMSLARPGEVGLSDLKISSPEWNTLNGSRIIPTGDSRRLIQVDGGFVLVEFKPFAVGIESSGPSRESSRRVNHLVNILHQEKPERYHCLAARGYFTEATRFALCFDIPQRLDPEYQSLSNLFKKLPEPDLEYKFILARDLANALSQFHAVEWIHKFFCSANVLFFNERGSTDLLSILKNPYLFGWEYSRPESGLSSRHFEKDDINENVYRHPEQWGLPTASFNKFHDIYSLGVVLLEIGFWKSAVSLHRRGFQDVELGGNVKNYLITSAKHQRLRAAMGRKYQAIVVACLEGGFTSPEVGQQTVGLETFKVQVINVLDKIISSIGAL